MLLLVAAVDVAPLLLPLLSLLLHWLSSPPPFFLVFVICLAISHLPSFHCLAGT